MPVRSRDGAGYRLDLLFPEAGIGWRRWARTTAVAQPHLAERGIHLSRYTASRVARDPAGVAAQILDPINEMVPYAKVS